MTPKQLYDLLNEAMAPDVYMTDWDDNRTEVTIDGRVDLVALDAALKARYAVPEGATIAVPREMLVRWKHSTVLSDTWREIDQLLHAPQWDR